MVLLLIALMYELESKLDRIEREKVTMSWLPCVRLESKLDRIERMP